ncbi:MAG: methyltransferase [Pseudomonadota bacterium]
MAYTPPELDWERLVLIAGGHTAFQLLWAGVELGLYDTLSARPGQTLDELAQALGLARQPARILLVGLTALGVVKLENGRYRNADVTEARMVSGKPGCVAPILGWQAHIVYPGMMDFVASLKANRNVGLARFEGTEPTLYERLTHDKTLEKIFQDSMSGLSRQANQFLPKAMDFSGYHHVVDAGGGDGTNAMAIARAYPGLKATVFDSPSVCAHARQNIAAAGMAERVDTWEGNFFDTPFPPDTDCVVYCHILTIWSMEKNRALLKRTFDALPTGGAVVIFNMMADDDDRGPLSTALGSPYFLAIATGEGMLHPWKDYEAALRDAGFRQTVRLDQGLPLDHGILVGIK